MLLRSAGLQANHTQSSRRESVGEGPEAGLRSVGMGVNKALSTALEDGVWFGEPRASQGAGEGFLSPVSLLGWWR